MGSRSARANRSCLRSTTATSRSTRKRSRCSGDSAGSPSRTSSSAASRPPRAASCNARSRGSWQPGWELDTQGFSHADLITLDAAALHYQVAVARETVRHRYGVPVNWFCYPSGHYDARVIAEVRAAGLRRLHDGRARLGATRRGPLPAAPAARARRHEPGAAALGDRRRSATIPRRRPPTPAPDRQNDALERRPVRVRRAHGRASGAGSSAQQPIRGWQPWSQTRSRSSLSKSPTGTCS